MHEFLKRRLEGTPNFVRLGLRRQPTGACSRPLHPLLRRPGQVLCLPPARAARRPRVRLSAAPPQPTPAAQVEVHIDGEVDVRGAHVPGTGRAVTLRFRFADDEKVPGKPCPLLFGARQLLLGSPVWWALRGPAAAVVPRA